MRLIFQVKSGLWVENRDVFKHSTSAMEKGYWAAIYTVSINSNRLLNINAYLTGNNSGCTVNLVVVVTLQV